MEPPMARDLQDDRRGHYRLRYPEAERPTVRINDLDYLVADLSEGGAGSCSPVAVDSTRTSGSPALSCSLMVRPFP